MDTLSLDHIKLALSGRAAAFRSVTAYQPAGGSGDKIFPVTYEGGSYATESHHIDGAEVPCVLIDSVQSQANRMEAALLDESVLLSDDALAAIARIDLVEADGVRATPVDYKRGAVPDVPGNAYEPERVQLCLQGLLLRANGFQCDEGVLYFVGSKRRVPVPFDDALVQRTLELLNDARDMAAGGAIPPPLEDSPQCPRCSLVGICLPDETVFLKGL